MPIEQLRVSGYRSVREMTLNLRRVNILVGPNGCGKSNLYQSVYLIWLASKGRLSQALADEGGFSSAVWAGPKGENPPKIRIGLTTDMFVYDLCFGNLCVPNSLFGGDPQIKEEHAKWIERTKPITILDRGKASCVVRNREGNKERYVLEINEAESVLSQVNDPHQYPALGALRLEIGKWRFYHQFRTDAHSPLREPQVASRTWVLSHDGRDLAAALQTIIENGNGHALQAAIARAFGGARLVIAPGVSGLEVTLHDPNLLRPFRARELSDGTLKYLCLLAALMSPIPAPLIALNEPEASLHPQMMEPLAEIIAAASLRSQIWLTTHSERLAELVEKSSTIAPIRLEKLDGATQRAGRPRGLAYSVEFDG